MIWVNLPDFPWHFYEWDAICRIVDPIGRIPLLMDEVTQTKTRPTIAKLNVEIVLSKPFISEIRNEQGWQTVTKRKNKDIPVSSEIMIRLGSNANENIKGSTSQAHSTKQERN